MEIQGLETGKFEVKTTSGDLEATGLVVKSSALTTVLGDFSLGGSPGDLNFTSVSGELNARYEDYANNLRVKTTSGGIELDLPDDAEFNLEAGSVSGHISCDFPLTIAGSRSAHRLQGTVGTGEYTVNIETISGNINLF